jgi:hypothetical protein
MRVVVSVGLMFDVETYQQAGKILDDVNLSVGKALEGVKSHHDITGFQTRPCKAAQFDQIAGGSIFDEPQQAMMPTGIGPEPSPDYLR